MKSRTSLTRAVLLIALLLLLANIVAADIGIEAMTEESLKISRGMSLYFSFLIFLAVLPWFNKYYASIITLFVALGLARGFIRVGEQDIVKTWMSMKFGLVFGLEMVIPFIVLNLVFVALAFIFNKVKPEKLKQLQKHQAFKVIKDNLTEKQIVNALEYGVKKGYEMKEIVKALKLKGASFWKINHVTYMCNSLTRTIFLHYRNAIFAMYGLLLTCLFTIFFFFFDFASHREKEYIFYLLFLLALIIFLFSYMKKHQKLAKKKTEEQKNEYY